MLYISIIVAVFFCGPALQLKRNNYKKKIGKVRQHFPEVLSFNAYFQNLWQIIYINAKTKQNYEKM